MDLPKSFTEDHEICMNLGNDPEKFLGAVIPPTFGNSLFVFSTYEKFCQAQANEDQNYVYWRGSNPTVEIVEKMLASLERGEKCKCFASGMAAINAALFNSVQGGDHVLCVSNIYTSTIDMLVYMKKFGVNHTSVYSTLVKDIEKAILPNTKVLYIESPTDYNFRLVDLQKLAELARSRGIRTIVDNTWATPLFQKPLTHGIDIVVHSASKYLGGHSDLVGGALITSKTIMKNLFTNEYLLFGGTMAPREASLLLRGLRTLPLRMKAHQENALQVAKFLSAHPAVAKVNYPGLPTHPDHELCETQLTGFSGLMTFELKNSSFEVMKKVINKVKIFRIGVSWGSFESLILSPNFGTNEDRLKKEHINPGMIRIAVGLELASELIRDLEQALDSIV